MIVRVWVCFGSWDIWGVISRIEGLGSSQTCFSLDIQIQLGFVQQFCFCRFRVGGRGVYFIQRLISGQCYGLRGFGCLFWLSCQLFCFRVFYFYFGGWFQFEGIFIRVKVTLIREVRQRLILRVLVKCLVRFTYRSRISVFRILNLMKRDVQKFVNFWRRRGGWEYLFLGYSVIRVQEEVLFLGCILLLESLYRVIEQYLSFRQDDTESLVIRLVVCRFGGCGTFFFGGVFFLCYFILGI